MADPPPPSPTPTVFNTPQQTTTAVDNTPPPVTQVALASLTLAFQTPSTLHSAASARTSLASSRTPDTHDQVAIVAAIDESSTRLPRYLTSLAGRNDVGVNLSSVLEEEAERGDGGDSDVEGEDAREHDGAMNDSLVDKDVNSSIEETNASCSSCARSCNQHSRYPA
jgi:hypothetical protein